MCATFAREQGRRTTGHQGDDAAVRSIEPLTPEAWRDLSASDDEDLDSQSHRGSGLCCADSHCPLVCLLLRRRTGIGTTRRCIPLLLRDLDTHEIVRSQWGPGRYSSRFHDGCYCTT